MSCRENCSSIFQCYSNSFTSHLRSQPVFISNSRNAHSTGRHHTRIIQCTYRYGSCIFCTINRCVYRFVIPIIANYAMNGGCSSGVNRCMSRPCVSGNIVKVSVFETISLVDKSFKTIVSVFVPKSIDIVVSHLVNNYAYNQFRFFLLSCLRESL